MPHTLPLLPSAFVRPHAVILAAAAALFTGTALAHNHEHEPATDEPAAASKNATRLEAMVVTAAGFEQKLTDAPASISVITRQELEQRPYMTLIDAVRDLEGVDVGETADKTGQQTISIRGMGADYTLILIDGRRQNNNGGLYPNSFSGNQFNHIPPLAAIERIEVIRGPASTLYGADALGGVINIITRKVTDTWTGQFSHSRTIQTHDDFGDDITTDFAVLGPVIPGKLGLTLRGSMYDRNASNPKYAPAVAPDGTVFTRSLGFGSGGRTVDNQNWNLGSRLNFVINESHDIYFDYEKSEQEYDNEANQLGTLDSPEATWRSGNANIPNPNFNPALPVDSSNPRTISRRVVQPRAGYSTDQRFTREQWAVVHNGKFDFGRSSIGLSYVETDNHGRTQPLNSDERYELQTLWNDVCARRGMGLFCNNGAQEDISYLTDTELARLNGFLPRPKRTLKSSQYTLDGKLELPFGNHFVVLGGQYIDGEMEDGVFGFYGQGYVEGETQENKLWALYAEDNWTTLDGLTLTAGVRYDDHNTFGAQTSPRLFGVYALNDQWTFKGGVSTGYKAPGTDALFPGIRSFGGQGVSPSVGNPTLKPETSVNSEIAVYFNSPAGHTLNLTYFQNQFKDKLSGGGDSIPACEIAQPSERCADVGIGWVNLGYSTFSQQQNIDKVDIQGIEVAGRYQAPWGISLRANYTWTDSEQKSGANAGRPLNNTAEHMANGSVHWKVNDRLNTFLSLEARSDRYRGWNATTNKADYYKDYEVFHLGASFKVSDTITLNGRVNNLFDNDFRAYQTTFIPIVDEATGIMTGYDASFTDDYNNKDKARNFWLSINVTF